jgi:hypothetical protein
MTPKDSDPIIDETREIRHRISERCGHDSYKRVAYYMELQAQHPERLLGAAKGADKSASAQESAPMSVPLTRELIHRALENTAWDHANSVLYDLCAQHPGHDRDDVIIAKLWLIGRTYAAAIERRRTNLDAAIGDAFYEDFVSPTIRKSGMNDWFRVIANDSHNDVSLSLNVHRKVIDLFSEISGLEKRSLASKYLHFHFPHRFYIYDSRARRAVRELTRSVTIHIPPLDVQDREYASFWFRCEALNGAIQNMIGRRLTPRQLDKVLLWYVSGSTAPSGTAVSSDAPTGADTD